MIIKCVFRARFEYFAIAKLIKYSRNISRVRWIKFIVGECILLRMYQISKYKQPSLATILQCDLLHTFITTCFG
jgi:hypothetical protein